ncbi:MAG: GNAT family N-acetyltransferase [Solirubrobacteraceae bacterium]
MRATAELRDATPGDAEAVAELLSEMGYPVSAADAADLLAAFSADAGSRVQVAEVSGALAGLIATHVVPRLDSERRSCRIVDLVVAERHRRNGIGAALIDAAEQEARQQECTRLDLSTGDWRPDAHAFYERMGFASHARALVKRLA